jgi:23S rRNA pseudouridine2457 synthase
MGAPLRYFLLNKPFGVVCQFSRETDRQTLADFGPFPRGLYPAGRLDSDSEGLVFLTNDNLLKHRLTEPRFGHPRSYLVQVEGNPDKSVLDRLRAGVLIRGVRTRPARAVLLAGEPDLPARPVPIRVRKTIPTAWLELTLREGRNRQVRHMTAAVGHPTLRLVRVAIGPLTLGDLQAGSSRELSEPEIEILKRGLHLKPPLSRD